MAVENVSPPARQLLWNAFVRSVRDNLLAEVAVQILRVGGVIVLARALRPEDFGCSRSWSLRASWPRCSARAASPMRSSSANC